MPIVTKAKPRDLPVNLSCMSVTSCTASRLSEKILQFGFGRVEGKISYV